MTYTLWPYSFQPLCVQLSKYPAPVLSSDSETITETIPPNTDQSAHLSPQPTTEQSSTAVHTTTPRKPSMAAPITN